MEIAKKLEEILTNCLYKSEEIKDGKTPENAVLVEGIMANFGFEPNRLESHRQEIIDILKQMPMEFHIGTGDGDSFLNLCNTEDGVQWGEHRNMEQLVVLAIGLKLGRYCFPKGMWKDLAVGMPYIAFNIEGFDSITPMIPELKNEQ